MTLPRRRPPPPGTAAPGRSGHSGPRERSPPWCGQECLSVCLELERDQQQGALPQRQPPCWPTARCTRHTQPLVRSLSLTPQDTEWPCHPPLQSSAPARNWPQGALRNSMKGYREKSAQGEACGSCSEMTDQGTFVRHHRCFTMIQGSQLPRESEHLSAALAAPSPWCASVSPPVK